MDDLRLPVTPRFPRFGVLDGCIYMYNVDTDDSTDVWIVRKQESEESSWSKMLHLPKRYYYHTLIACSKKDSSRFILIYHNFDGLTWYDQQENKRVPFQLQTSLTHGSVELCINSLVSIPGCSVTKMQQVKD